MSEGFFSRWSRRKQAQAAAVAATAPDSPTAPTETAQAPAPAAVASTAPGHARAADSGQHDARRADLPTLEDVKALTPGSDFQPFMQPGVGAEVRNAAMKKLFADPHFNVMDGLDVYIDDYSQPDPMPAGMLRKMASAQFLRLVPDEPPATVRHLHDPADPGVQTSAPEVVAQWPDSSAQASAPDHDHPDLQLQPDPAPADPGPGPRAG